MWHVVDPDCTRASVFHSLFQSSPAHFPSALQVAPMWHIIKAWGQEVNWVREIHPAFECSHSFSHFSIIPHFVQHELQVKHTPFAHGWPLLSLCFQGFVWRLNYQVLHSMRGRSLRLPAFQRDHLQGPQTREPYIGPQGLCQTGKGSIWNNCCFSTLFPSVDSKLYWKTV